MAELKGWVAIHRSICENDLWFLEPFTKAQAWIDLLLNANHKDGEINIRGNIIHIKRGQIGWSQITMAKRWRWSRQKVRRFLEYLIIEQMISIDNSEITPRQLRKTIQQNRQQKKSKLTSITTIINYEQYQTLQQTLQQTIQQKDNRRYINNNDNNDNNIPKGMGQAQSYGNSDINKFIKGVNKYLEVKLPDDGKARQVARNALELFTKKNSKGNIKQGREFLKEDKWENVKDFLAYYLEEKVDKGYSAQSWFRLYDNIRLWIANEGKIPSK